MTIGITMFATDYAIRPTRIRCCHCLINTLAIFRSSRKFSRGARPCAPVAATVLSSKVATSNSPDQTSDLSRDRLFHRG